MFPRFRVRPWTSALLGLGFLVASVEPSIAQTAAAPGPAVTDAMVALPDGRRIHLICSGTGTPTVILEAGLGLGSSIWMRVLPGLAAITRTCTYDRAGYGQSDPGPMPRDSTRRAADLAGLLDATGESGPFVLVAHSAAERTGRLIARARRDIVGLVLVDPGADLDALKAIGPVWAAAYAAGQSAALRCIRATAAGEMKTGNAIYLECGSPPTVGPLASQEMAAAVLSENEPDPSGSNEAAPTLGSLGDLPLVVLTAEDKFGPNEGAAPTETPSLRQAWLEAGAMIAASSTQGEQRLVSGASHVIQFEQPQAVIDAVRDVVEKTRSGASGQGPVS